MEKGKMIKISQGLDSFANFCMFMISLLITFACITLFYVAFATIKSPLPILSSIVAVASGLYFLVHSIKGMHVGYKESIGLLSDKESLVKIILGSILLYELFSLINDNPTLATNDDWAMVIISMAICSYLLTILQPLRE